MQAAKAEAKLRQASLKDDIPGLVAWVYVGGQLAKVWQQPDAYKWLAACMTCTAATRPRWLARQRWRRLRPQAGRGVVAAVESAEVVAGRSSWRRGSSLSMHVALLRMIHDSPSRPHTLNCFNRRPLQVEIPSLIVGRIIGKGGSTIKEITTRRARAVSRATPG